MSELTIEIKIELIFFTLFLTQAVLSWILIGTEPLSWIRNKTSQRLAVSVHCSRRFQHTTGVRSETIKVQNPPDFPAFF